MAGRGSENLYNEDPPRRAHHPAPKPTLAERHEEYEALKQAARELLRAYEMIFPGIKYITVQDYALINEAPFNMRRLIEE